MWIIIPGATALWGLRPINRLLALRPLICRLRWTSIQPSCWFSRPDLSLQISSYHIPHDAMLAPIHWIKIPPRRGSNQHLSLVRAQSSMPLNRVAGKDAFYVDSKQFYELIHDSFRFISSQCQVNNDVYLSKSTNIIRVQLWIKTWQDSRVDVIF